MLPMIKKKYKNKSKRGKVWSPKIKNKHLSVKSTFQLWKCYGYLHIPYFSPHYSWEWLKVSTKILNSCKLSGYNPLKLS